MYRLENFGNVYVYDLSLIFTGLKLLTLLLLQHKQEYLQKTFLTHSHMVLHIAKLFNILWNSQQNEISSESWSVYTYCLLKTKILPFENSSSAQLKYGVFQQCAFAWNLFVHLLPQAKVWVKSEASEQKSCRQNSVPWNLFVHLLTDAEARVKSEASVREQKEPLKTTSFGLCHIVYTLAFILVRLLLEV